MRENRQSGFALPLVLAVVVVGVIAVGAVAYFQLKPKPQSQLTQTVNQPKFSPPQATSPTKIDETANWNVYRNETYNFELRYPREWVVIAPTDESIRILPTDFLYNEERNNMVLTITPVDMADRETVFDSNKNRIGVPKEGLGVIERKPFAGKDAYQYSCNWCDQKFYLREIRILDTMDIDWEERNDISWLARKDHEYLITTFDQILSTFKFFD